MGAYSGFNVGWANATTIGVAHPIAELPIFSGFEVRVLLNIINFAICYFFTVRYMKTIRKDPMKSLNYEEGMSVADLWEQKVKLRKRSTLPCPGSIWSAFWGWWQPSR